jgi:hypothetical protein
MIISGQPKKKPTTAKSFSIVKYTVFGFVSTGVIISTAACFAYLGVKHPHNLKWIKEQGRTLLVDVIIGGKVKPLFDAAQLPHIKLDISFKNIERLNGARNEVIKKKTSALHEKLWVKATIDKRNLNIPVEARGKGEGLRHYIPNNYSLTIKTRKEAAFMGMRRFSIQNPRTSGRSHKDILFSQILKKYGVLGANIFFARHSRNGKDMGLVLVEEIPTKEFLERYGRRNGPVFRFSESKFNSLEATFSTKNAHQWAGHFEQAPFSLMFDRKAVNSSMVTEASKTLMRKFILDQVDASEIFDAEKWAIFVLLSEIYGADHGLDWMNMRLYFNPITLKFEPISWNPLPIRWKAAARTSLINKDELLGHPNIIKRIFSSPVMKRAYDEAIKRIIPDLLNPAFAKALKEQDTIYRIQQLFYFRQYNFFPDPFYVSEIISKAKYIQFSLEQGTTKDSGKKIAITPSQKMTMSKLAGNIVSAGFTINDKKASIYVKNLAPFPITIFSLQKKSSRLQTRRSSENLLAEQQKIELPAYSESENFIKKVEVPFTEDDNTLVTSLTAYATIKGTQEPIEINIPLDFGTRKGPLYKPSSIKIDYPQFSIDEAEQRVTIPPGSWRVDRSIVLKPGWSLEIRPGATLSFADKAIVAVHGAVIMRGSPEMPIRLQPQESSLWGGISVIGNRENSVIENVYLSGIKRPTTALDFLTGALTVEDTVLKVDNLRISNIQAEDALNIVNSEIDLKNITVSDVSSDAVDMDFCTGQLKGLMVIRSAGDGLDISTTNLEAENLTFSSIQDKAISVGEQSKAHLKNIDITNAEIGIASKDLSYTEVENISLKNIRKFPFMAYNKKPELGPGALIVKDYSYAGAKIIGVSQTGSMLSLNGDVINNSKLDINKLYNSVREK